MHMHMKGKRFGATLNACNIPTRCTSEPRISFLNEKCTFLSAQHPAEDNELKVVDT